MHLTPGTRLGRYEIRSPLGAGGMAEVYVAEDMELGRKVALKLLPPDSTADEHARKRLLREARAIAALTHPHICAIYDVGESDGQRFIAMQLVDGEPLDVRLRRARLAQPESVSIGCDIVDALAEAHDRGIIHRDIKPSNIVITPRGHAVVLDFGLARLIEEDAGVVADAVTQSVLSAPGVMLGTVPYMSPEQVRGDAVDGRSDLFSVGVLLYQMAAGQRPFDDKTSAATAAAILTREPAPLADAAPSIAPELARIVTKALRKSPEERYQTAKDLFVDLRALRESSGSGATQAIPVRAVAGSRRRLRAPVVAAIAIVAGLGAGGWYAWRQSRIRMAEEQIAQAEALTKERRYFEAFDLAIAAERVLPRDPALARLMPTLAMTLSVKTDPPGARVYARRYSTGERFPERVLLGTTPLVDTRLGRGEYVLQIEKEGFATLERTIYGSFAWTGSFQIAPPPAVLDYRLAPAQEVPAGMVPVSGTEYRLASWERPTDRLVHLDDFYIDKYEVSNRDFREFITSGGYHKREYWTVPFVKDGRPITWDDAMKMLVDQTGLSGPRSWSGQNVPDGRADHPVTDITWYEAAAYAAFRGKQLPTIFQWERAARYGPAAAAVNFMPWGAFQPGATLAHRANFDNRGTMPVTSHPFGMSPFGAFNMAGNVLEWTANDTSEGIIATGGAWGDPTYVFGQFSRFPAFYSSAKLGFRCALTRPGARGSQGAERIEITEDIPVYTANSPAEFAKRRAVYDYPPAPLDAVVEDRQETADWTRERITFASSRGERAIAYLYLPKHSTGPLQVINFVPASDVDRGFRSLPASMEDRLAAFIKGGRAAFGVVLTGYQERLRPGGAPRPDLKTVEYLEELVARITDLRRGIDYLVTRPDIDPSKIAFFGPSAGAQLGIVLAAVETRYRAVAFVGAGLPASARDIIDRANPIVFAAHIKPPKLMVHGKYDEDTPLQSAGMPLFNLMPQPKRLELYEGGHVPPDGVAVSRIGPFLDSVLGPVKR